MPLLAGRSGSAPSALEGLVRWIFDPVRCGATRGQLTDQPAHLAHCVPPRDRSGQGLLYLVQVRGGNGEPQSVAELTTVAVEAGHRSDQGSEDQARADEILPAGDTGLVGQALIAPRRRSGSVPPVTPLQRLVQVLVAGRAGTGRRLERPGDQAVGVGIVLGASLLARSRGRLSVFG
jgi:hypothetical protein